MELLPLIVQSVQEIANVGFSRGTKHRMLKRRAVFLRVADAVSGINLAFGGKHMQEVPMYSAQLLCFDNIR